MASPPRRPTVYDSRLTADVPHFAPPTTPSRSPYKDTLHRRSPTRQLRSSKPALDYDEYHKLVNSGTSTAAEKELALRVVRAAEKLRDWCAEIEQWGWSGSFDKRHGRDDVDPFQEVELCASLSQEQVVEYDARLDSIDGQLQDLDVDELKEQILGIHLGRSRPSSSYSTQSLANVVLYDDFQLFGTETLMYTLPYHAKLKRYLQQWQVRLVAFTEIPTYLGGLKFMEEILDEAWQGLRNASSSWIDVNEINALEGQLETAQYMLKGKVAELGAQLDRMLDILEGGEDRLPDAWIDKYEDSEKSYTDWTYEADRKLLQLRMLEHELERRKEMDEIRAKMEADHQTLKENVNMASDEPNEASTPAQHAAFAASVVVDILPHGHDSHQIARNLEESSNGVPPSTLGMEFYRKVSTKPGIDESPQVLVDTENDGLKEQQEDDGPELPADVLEKVLLPQTAPAQSAEEAPQTEMTVSDVPLERQEDQAEEKVPTELVDEEELLAEEEPVIAVAVSRPIETALRRASVASIESFTRDQVKSVDVPSRRNSGASFASSKRQSSHPLDSPLSSSPLEAALRKLSKPTSPLAIESIEPTTEFPNLHFESEDARQQSLANDVPTIRRNSVSSIASSDSYASEQEQGEESPSMRASKTRSAQLVKPPLNYAMKKRPSNNTIDESRGVSNPFSDQEVLALNTTQPANPPSQTSPSKFKSPISPSVPLEEQISTILESLPQRIRFRSGPSPSAADIKPKHKRKSSVSSVISDTAPRQQGGGGGGGGVRSRATTPSLSTRPTITLAPADYDIPRRSGANDPEIKIYHLTSGNDKPLKLFVRRVGENGERVMVRVGGGWADLAEYLKNYADHHGHRTVSESAGKVEILGLGSGGGNNERSPTPTPTTLTPGRSDSRMGFRSDSRQEMRGDSAAAPRRASLVNPASSSSIGYPSIAADSHTPGSETQRMRTSGLWDEGGLMGLKAGKKDAPMSEEKKEWVDSVVEQAKRVGAAGVIAGSGGGSIGGNGSGNRKVEFGDLGKKGATRRVFLRGGRATSGTAPGSGE